MKPHVIQTIADLEAERLRLDTLIEVLKRYAAADSTPEPQPALARNGITELKPKRKYKPRNPKVPALDVRSPATKAAAESPRRRGRARQTPEQAAASVTTMLSEPTTFAAAMKQFVLSQTGTFTARACWDAVQAKHPELCNDYAWTNAYVNLKYWATSGNLTIDGTGEDAIFKVVNRDWFKPKE